MCLHLRARSLSANAEMHETLHDWQRTACEVYITSQTQHCCLKRSYVQASAAWFCSHM